MVHFQHKSIISDLKLLVKLLQKYEFESSHAMELHQIQNIIGKNKTNICLNYDIEDVVFNIRNSGMKVKPNVKNISVIIDTSYQLKENLSANEDIFKSYSFQLYLKGYPNESNKEEYSFFCWHLDREPNKDGNLIHPFYHFHAGGKNIKNYELGQLLMISSPRIPHPPMDIFLSIHFVILNFFHSEEFPNQKKILMDEDYIAIIDRAQKRILDPYFAIFNGGTHSEFTRYNLFPLYV